MKLTFFALVALFFFANSCGNPATYEPEKTPVVSPTASLASDTLWLRVIEGRGVFLEGKELPMDQMSELLTEHLLKIKASGRPIPPVAYKMMGEVGMGVRGEVQASIQEAVEAAGK